MNFSEVSVIMIITIIIMNIMLIIRIITISNNTMFGMVLRILLQGNALQDWLPPSEAAARQQRKRYQTELRHLNP